MTDEGATQDFAARMSYAGYLDLDRLLQAQHPLSTAHDELLFIIQHQTSELWMHLALHELRSARSLIAVDDVQPAFKLLTRVARIFEQLNGAWDVLRTMTPSDYTEFRDQLGQSSGFQSFQYREIEFVLGNRNQATLRVHEHRPQVLARLQAELAVPSLYDEALRLLARRGLPVPADRVERDWSEPYVASEAVEQAWLVVYRDPDAHWDLYQLGEELTDLEDMFRLWRFRHVTTVERVIGFKRGTGGTGGVSYLRKMLDVVLFPEIWKLRTDL